MCALRSWEAGENFAGQSPRRDRVEPARPKTTTPEVVDVSAASVSAQRASGDTHRRTSWSGSARRPEFWLPTKPIRNRPPRFANRPATGLPMLRRLDTIPSRFATGGAAEQSRARRLAIGTWWVRHDADFPRVTTAVTPIVNIRIERPRKFDDSQTKLGFSRSRPRKIG